MKILFIIMASVFFMSCQVINGDNQPETLKFFVVHDNKIIDGIYIDTPTLPKLGYIKKKPDFEANKLENVLLSVSRAITYSGGETQMPCLIIHFVQEDKATFAKFTADNIGEKILMSIGNEPIFAPTLRVAIDIGRIECSMPGKNIGDCKRIQEKLKLLIKK